MNDQYPKAPRGRAQICLCHELQSEPEYFGGVSTWGDDIVQIWCSKGPLNRDSE